MGFMKRKKQPALFRNPSVNPTPEVVRIIAAEPRPVSTAVLPTKKVARRSAKKASRKNK